MANITVQAPDGKTYTLPWSEQRDPTDQEIDALIAAQRGQPNNAPNDNDSFIEPVIENIKGIGQFAKDMLIGGAGAFFAPGNQFGQQERNRVIEGFIDPFKKGAATVNKAADEYLAGNISPVSVIGKVGKAAAKTTAESAGIPVDPLKLAIKEGKLKRAAGLSVIPVALAIAGGMSPRRAAAKKVAEAGELHGPVPPVTGKAITDPGRMLPSSTGLETPLAAPRKPFYSGSAGVSDPNLGYFRTEANEVFPVEDVMAAEHGLEPMRNPSQLAEGPSPGPIVHDTTPPEGIIPLKPEVKTPQPFTRLDYGLERTAPYNPVESLAPDRMRAPSTNQTVFEALLPKDLGARSKYARPPVKMPPKKPDWFVEAVEVKPNEGVRLTEAELNEAARVRKAINDRKPSPIKTVSETITKASEAVPVNAPQAQKIVQTITKDSWFRDVYDRAFTSVSTQLTRISPELGKLVHKTRTEANQLGGEYANRIRKAARKLSKEENLLAYRILDGTAQISDTTPGKVKSAVARIREVTRELGELAEKSGIHIRVGPGESVPFKMMEGEYAPHVYPEKVLKDEVSLTQRLIDSGKTAEEAKKIIANSRQFGERYISPTHAREFNMPGYAEDLSVFEKYAYDMAERLKQAEHFGPKDIGDKTSPLSQLIERSTNPEKANRVITEYLDRGRKADASLHKAAQVIVNAEVLTHLSLSAINQVADLAGVPVRTGTRNFVAGLRDTIFRYGDSVDVATETGALAIMKKEILKDISQGHWASMSYGLSKMEEVVRTISATSGKAAVQDLFTKLKAASDAGEVAKVSGKGKIKFDNRVQRMRSELGRLLDEDIDTVLKQDKLTDKQINLAGGRTVELINSIPDKLSLPPAFTYYNPLVRLPLLFKRFAFTTTKNLASAIRENPRRVIPAVVAYGLIGELTGDVKTIIVNSVNGDMDKIVDAVAARGDKSPLGDFGNKHVNRAVANLMQSWFLGMFGDVAEGVSRGWRGTAGLVGGPVASDLYELGEDVMQAGKGNFKPTAKSLVKRVPFVGQGLSRTLFPPKEKKNYM